MEEDKKKSFKCEICDSHFKQNRGLKYHISSVHEEKKQVMCQICGKTFQHKKSLSGHIATTHEGKKPFKCNICDYSCLLKIDMNRQCLLDMFESSW